MIMHDFPFPYSTKGLQNCKYCNLKLDDWIASHVTIFSCLGVNIFSCCGGKSGGSSRWDSQDQKWKCSDCGSPTSTDPSYVGTKIDEKKPWWVSKEDKVCECGGSKAKTTHAFYCPLWKKY